MEIVGIVGFTNIFRDPIMEIVGFTNNKLWHWLTKFLDNHGNCWNCWCYQHFP